jgi:hypothetical protein
MSSVLVPRFALLVEGVDYCSHISSLHDHSGPTYYNQQTLTAHPHKEELELKHPE